MKIYLEKDVCSNVDISLRKEWLEANQLGSYACSTIYGLNYRKYHGLFIIPGKSQNDHQLLLTKFEESVFINSQVYEISANRLVGGIHPDGYKYLQIKGISCGSLKAISEGQKYERYTELTHTRSL